jgi:hypothetical protein
MNYLKTFKDKLFEFKVKRICEQHKIKNWSINKNGLVDVNGDVKIVKLSMSKLPIAFGQVNGDFRCYQSSLKTLQGCPKSIIGDFDCSSNELTDLKGGPEYVEGYYACDNNKLTSLEGAPETINAVFNCGNNKLTSLKGGPRFVAGNLFCGNNLITSLQFGPEEINGEPRPIHYLDKDVIDPETHVVDNSLVRASILPNPISNIPKEYLNAVYLDFILCNQSDWSLYRKDGTVYLNRLEEMIEWGIETGKIKDLE